MDVEADPPDAEHSQRADEGAAGLDEVDQELESAKVDNAEKVRNYNLGTIVGYGAVALTVLQVGVADYVFIKYALKFHWKVPQGAMQAWLAATVIQVVGIVLVITRSLFPSGGKG